MAPSRGCRTCVSRRVKCDYAEPVCARCKKGNRECLWDPNDSGGLHFKSENVFASGKPRRPRGSKRSPTQTVAVVKPSVPEPQAALSIPLEEHAFLFYAANFVFRPDDLPEAGHEYNTHVLFHWIRARPGSPLHHALSAFSHASFGRARKIPQAIEDANRAYVRAIGETHKAVSDQSTTDSDQLLLTIMLMGTYEHITFGDAAPDEPGSPPYPTTDTGVRFWKVFTHFEGATSLLKVRRLQGHSKDSPLDRSVRRQILRAAILRGQAVPKWLQDGAEYGEEGPSLDIDTFMIRAAAARARSIDFFSETSHTPMTMDNIVDVASEARTLDIDLTKWSWRVPEDWRYTTTDDPANTTGKPNHSSFNGRIHNYDNYSHASIWIRYRALRLITNSIMLRCLTTAHTIDPNLTHLFSKADLLKKIMDSLATEMCASVPYFFTQSQIPVADSTLLKRSVTLGQHTIHANAAILPKVAGLLAWPLTVAVSTEHVPEPQRQWLQARLKQAAEAMGDTVLEKVAERGDFRF